MLEFEVKKDVSLWDFNLIDDLADQIFSGHVFCLGFVSQSDTVPQYIIYESTPYKSMDLFENYFDLIGLGQKAKKFYWYCTFHEKVKVEDMQ